MHQYGQEFCGDLVKERDIPIIYLFMTAAKTRNVLYNSIFPVVVALVTGAMLLESLVGLPLSVCTVFFVA